MTNVTVRELPRHMEASGFDDFAISCGTLGTDYAYEKAATPKSPAAEIGTLATAEASTAQVNDMQTTANLGRAASSQQVLIAA